MTCNGCRAEIKPGDKIFRHKRTKSILCAACEKRMVLHSPQDWIEEVNK